MPVLQLLANSTISFKPFMGLLSTMWHADRKIKSSEWQTTVLRTAATLDAPYEWDVNEPVGRIFGFGEAHLAALRDVSKPLPASLFTERQQAIGELIKDIGQGSAASAMTMERLKSLFSDEEVMELFYTHGVYAFLARMMNSCRIDYDPEIPGLEDMLRKYNAKAIEKELGTAAAANGTQ
jgi:hypothetical protein